MNFERKGLLKIDTADLFFIKLGWNIKKETGYEQS